MRSRPADRLISPVVPRRQEFLVSMRADLRDWPERMSTLYVSPEETAAAAEIAIQARLSVLMRVYRDDYHTDSFDIVRLADQVRAGDESIVFWGAADEVARLREAFVTGVLPQDLELGTNTFLSAETEWGTGYFEFTRNGSMSTAVSALRPFLWRTYSFLCGGDREVHERYHTMIGIARNRASTPDVRGGELMHRIVVRYIRAWFWGLLPFYVMQGGVLEQTDYRELPRDSADVSKALLAAPLWYFADDQEAHFATALVRLNGLPVPETVVTPRSSAPEGSFDILLPPPELVATNHGTVSPRTEEGAGHDLTDAVAKVVSAGVSCSAVRLPLTDPTTINAQHWLRGQGFRLTALSPPKHTWIVRDGVRQEIELDAVGIWTRPRPDLPVAPPYYLDLVTSPEELEVVAYLKAL